MNQKLTDRESLLTGTLFVVFATGIALGAAAETYHYTNQPPLMMGGVTFLGVCAVGFLVGRIKRTMGDDLQKDTAAVSPVIGVILMVAITVVLAAVVFFMVQHLSNQSGTQDTPKLAFSSSGASAYTLISAPNGLSWSDFTVNGCTTVPTGTVTAGQQITGCAGTVNVVYKPTNSVTWTNG